MAESFNINAPSNSDIDSIAAVIADKIAAGEISFGPLFQVSKNAVRFKNPDGTFSDWIQFQSDQGGDGRFGSGYFPGGGGQQGSGNGDVTNGDNVGGGPVEIFAQKNGSILEFRTLQGGANINIQQLGNVVEIDAAGDVINAANVGGQQELFRDKVGGILNFRTLSGDTGVVITQQADTLSIDSSSLQRVHSNIITYSGTGPDSLVFGTGSAVNYYVFTNGLTGEGDLPIPNAVDDGKKIIVASAGGGPVVTVNATGGKTIDQGFANVLIKDNGYSEFTWSQANDFWISSGTD